MIKIKLLRSWIGCSPIQRRTLDALVLRKIRMEREYKDSPTLRGMIENVKHLVEVGK